MVSSHGKLSHIEVRVEVLNYLDKYMKLAPCCATIAFGFTECTAF